MQTVIPFLLYGNVPAAIEWLSNAFGFEERVRFADDNGVVTHAEVWLGNAQVALGYPGPGYRSPKELDAFTHLVHVYVPDVDAHYAQAVEAGARIHAQPQDMPYGDRRYDAEDLEGHRWSFAQRLREVAPEEWGAVRAG